MHGCTARPKNSKWKFSLALAYEIEARGSPLHMFCLSGEGICHERFKIVSHQRSLTYEIRRNIPGNI